jgi:hypothetical protein
VGRPRQRPRPEAGPGTRLIARVRASVARAVGRWPGTLRRPVWRSALRGLALLLSLVAAVLHPALAVVALAVWLWVLWPWVARRRRFAAPAPPAQPARVFTLRVRYHGGHPALPRPGLGVLRVWPDDGAALLQVGRWSVAFPLQTVQAVTLVEGRVLLSTGCRGWLAETTGRLLAMGMGGYCGLQRQRDEDLAVIDRSRVLCDLQRQGRPCRMVLTGPRGGGEEVYLEALVMLRPLAAWREPGAAGGSMGAATSPPSGVG